MNLKSIFKPVYAEQAREHLEMCFLSPVGVRVYLPNGAKYVTTLQKRCFSYAIINCSDIDETIKVLKKESRATNIIAHLDKKNECTYNGKGKNLLTSFALLYDFVDAFVVSGFDALSDDIDQLINLRMYNDEYRPILMEIPDGLLLDELDEIIAYARFSGVDGLLFSNLRLLKYAHTKSAGSALTMIYENSGNIDDLAGISESGAKLICISSERNPMNVVCKGRRLIKRIHRLFLQGFNLF